MTSISVMSLVDARPGVITGRISFKAFKEEDRSGNLSNLGMGGFSSGESG